MSELSGLPCSRFIPVVQKDAEVISNGIRINGTCECGKVVTAVFLPNLRQTKFMECKCGKTVRIVCEPSSGSPVWPEGEARMNHDPVIKK